MSLGDHIIFWHEHRERPKVEPWERMEGSVIVDISQEIEDRDRWIRQRFTESVKAIRETPCDTMAAFRG